MMLLHRKPVLTAEALAKEVTMHSDFNNVEALAAASSRYVSAGHASLVTP